MAEGSEHEAPRLGSLPTGPHAEVLRVDANDFFDRKTSTLLRDMSLQLCANDTAHLDYHRGSTTTNDGLVQIDLPFADTIVLFFIVPSYHTVGPYERDSLETGTIVDATAAEVERDSALGMRRLTRTAVHNIRQDLQRIFAGDGVRLTPEDVQLVSGLQELGRKVSPLQRERLQDSARDSALQRD